MVRWPSGLRRQLKVVLLEHLFAGPKGRGFKSHSHQQVFALFAAGCGPTLLATPSRPEALVRRRFTSLFWFLTTTVLSVVSARQM